MTSIKDLLLRAGFFEKCKFNEVLDKEDIHLNDKLLITYNFVANNKSIQHKKYCR